MMELARNITRGSRILVTVREKPQISTWGIFETTEIEAPVFLGMSQIETSHIGAFTYINLRSVSHVTTNCVVECESIGRFCMIGHGVHIGLPSHPTDFLSNHLVFRYDDKSKYAHAFMTMHNDEHETMIREKYKAVSNKSLPIIGNDVWIGYGATVLNGVHIGDGAIVAACSVVTQDVPPYSIVGGNPAKVIRYRFEEEDIKELLEISWWEYGPDILHGINITDCKMGLKELRRRISAGAEKFKSPYVVINNWEHTTRICEN